MKKKTSKISDIPVYCNYDAAVDLESLKPNPRNPNKHPDAQIALLAKVIRAQGWRNPVIVSNRSGFIVRGHGRLQAAQVLNVAQVPVEYQDYATEADEYADMIADNRIAELAEQDNAMLKDLLEELDTGGMDMDSTGYTFDAIEDLMTQFHQDAEQNAEPQIDKAEELNQTWKVKTGDLWLIGEHRLLCGDSTSADDVGRVMDGEKAQLIHADPPYGMGKEKDGVQNDNLYAEKLDAFQMAWWRVFRPQTENNGSAYIWGNAPDLWRLWYRGGLKDSERLTFRSEIVWDKGGGGFGVGTEAQRCFFPEERCLFFMLGEQGFNNNADNYWEGWEPIRSYLETEMNKVGGVKQWKNALGNQMGGHYFTKSQWCFPTEDAYKKLQSFAKGDAFKREHDELKREFYATRAYFDNAHDNMTDVWDFGRVTGEDRHGHATPKPVIMIQRCIKSSTPGGAIVADPFLGSGTTMVAAQNLNRKCYGIEISPAYCAVILQRMKDAFPDIEIRKLDD